MEARHALLDRCGPQRVEVVGRAIEIADDRRAWQRELPVGGLRVIFRHGRMGEVLRSVEDALEQPLDAT